MALKSSAFVCRAGTAPGGMQFQPQGARRISWPTCNSGCSRPGGRLIQHARYFMLQLAESHLTRSLFRQILGRIERLAGPPT